MPKINVLVDSNTIIDKYFLGEPALSFLINYQSKKILFDTGYSDVFLKNAKNAKLNLDDIDYIVLSHGHNDHTGGLSHLISLFKDKEKKPKIIAHPDIFLSRFDDKGDFGCPLSKESLEKVFDLNLHKEPYFLTDNIIFLGEIPRRNDFEGKNSVGIQKISNMPDYVMDDSALILKRHDGIIIVVGCSHSGISNICEYAKEITKTNKIISVIGGLHLKKSSIEHINKTANYIETLNLNSLYACHCTGLKAQCIFDRITNLKEVGSGLEIKI
ncbi:MAG: MBL fold metallo-hydrolase [Cyanobacteria bacterium SIG30]|nr:MBL fold metallo-hydrolase [Cyanobacteria bacterium SIG30]